MIALDKLSIIMSNSLISYNVLLQNKKKWYKIEIYIFLYFLFIFFRRQWALVTKGNDEEVGDKFVKAR